MKSQTTRSTRPEPTTSNLASRAVRSVAGLAVAGALVVTAAACGSGNDTAEAPAGNGAPAPTSAAPTTPAASTTPGGTAATTATPDAAARNQGALAAVATAASAAGGTAYEIDDEQDDQTWEVDVMVGDRSVEVKVSADGGTVQGQDDDDDADNEDRARLDRAQTTIAEAIEAALREVPGTLDDVELDDRDNVDVWEVTVDTPDNDDVEVYVATDDARIITVER